jgi:hypothetical protein
MMVLPAEIVAQLGPTGAAVVALGYLVVKARKIGTGLEEAIEEIRHQVKVLGTIVKAISRETDGLDDDRVDEALEENGLKPEDFLDDRG